MPEEVDFVREHPISTEIPVYTGTATFINGEEKTYTYHEKVVKDNVIVLYEYDTDSVSARPTHFGKKSIQDEQGNEYREKVPFPPELYCMSKTEAHIVSLHTCEDFAPEQTGTETLTHDNWATTTKMPEPAAEAYLNHFGPDKAHIRY